MKLSIITIIVFVLSGMRVTPLEAQDQDQTWIKMDDGFEYGEFPASIKSISGEDNISIVRINPELYSFHLLTCDELGHSSLTAAEWTLKYQMLGVFNAGMFLTDHKTNVGYMKNYSHINNPRISSQYHSVAAFNPVDSTTNSFMLFDTDDYDINEIIPEYNTVIQNLRLIKSPGKNRWSKQEKRWSELALGQDTDGNILLIFSRSPYSMHELNSMLIDLPISIDRAQHLEGGTEASIYITHGGHQIEKIGSYESSFNENDDIKSFWPIPNVIGIRKR